MKTTNIQIREAALADLDAILQLCSQLVQFDHQFDDSLDLAWANSAEGRKLFEDRINNHDGILLIAVDDSKIVGYLLGGLVEAQPYRTLKTLAELEELFVSHEYRSFQVGTKLINAFIYWCKKMKAEKISVVVSRDNHRGINFYKRSGFSEHNMLMEMPINN